MAAENPIVQRIDWLHGQWVEFAENDEARLLVWQATAQEVSLIEAYLAREGDERTAQTGDVFLRLQTPFAATETHGRALVQELSTLYAEAQPLFEQDGLNASWNAEPARKGEGDVEALLRALTALREAHLENPDAKLALWLDPAEAQDVSAYVLWLQKLLKQAPSEQRFIVVDSRDASAFAPLAKVEETRVQALRCNLDVPGAIVALAERADNGTPGAKFRALVAKLGQALSAGNMLLGLPLALLAGELALAQGWPHLAAVVQMMLAGAQSGQQKLEEAAKSYEQAESLGKACEAQAAAQAAAAQAEGAAPSGPPGEDLGRYGRELQLQARLGRAATLVAGSAWKKAAEVYAGTLALAVALGNGRAEIDCYRMASVCWDQADAAANAWEFGSLGMKRGATLDEETRQNSTLAYLAEHLERFTQRRSDYRNEQRGVTDQAKKMLGPEWRPKPPSGAA